MLHAVRDQFSDVIAAQMRKMPLYVKGKSLEYISSYTTDRYAAGQTYAAADK